MYNVEELKTNLSRNCGLHVDLVINENHSHLFTVLERRPSKARLSIHRMFLEAPTSVVEALGSYLLRFDKRFLTVISRYIDENVHKPQYKQVPKDIETRGDFFDLEELYGRVKEYYFPEIEPLMITWFQQKKSRSRIVFGQYHPLLRLIRINKKLDHRLVPSYFVEYVIFHEMLHHVIPSKTTEEGRRSIHSPEFQREERRFQEFQRAIEWQNKHNHLFFGGVC